MIAGYLIAGANHFRDPSSYIRIIPPYFPMLKVINIAAGLFELLFAVMLMFPQTRRLAAWGIILMLLAFLPVHIKMVQDAPFLLGGNVLITPLVAWIRLVVLQPLLILWAWWYACSVKSWLSWIRWVVTPIGKLTKLSNKRLVFDSYYFITTKHQLAFNINHAKKTTLHHIGRQRAQYVDGHHLPNFA